MFAREASSLLRAVPLRVVARARREPSSLTARFASWPGAAVGASTRVKTMGFEVADDDWDDAALTDAVVRAEVDAKASIASMTAAAPLMDRVNASVDSVAGRDSRGAPAKPPPSMVPTLTTTRPAPPQPASTVPPDLANALRATLSEYFGHSDFREGQMSVIAAAVSDRDSCVYWSTGSGKSLCYQLPALHTGKTTLVVSPLISLMNDQVTHLNNTAGASGMGKGDAFPLAAFLGSTQTDRSVEENALRGAYRVVYVTPEKLVGSFGDDTGGNGYFLSRLKEMVRSKKLGLVAIDEAHCLSQWGHDFRTSYRGLARVRAELAPNGEVPIMALTATAVDAVREDIASVLELRAPFVAQNSCDRPNLAVSVIKKRGGAADLKHVVDRVAGVAGSVIIYCPTVREVEQVASHLGNVFASRPDGAKNAVGTYHAQMSPSERERVHREFLTGRRKVVVATVAFGMGIDKPDIRLVMHYGAPKTMEEYYQQVGRAGRDGLPSKVEMLYGDGDFSKYGSDFYVGGLSETVRRTQKASTDALERFSREPLACRRAGILAHFGESPPESWPDSPDPAVAGKVCGTCDTCVRVRRAAEDGGVAKTLRRDMAFEAAPVLIALHHGFGGGPVPMTALASLAKDGADPKTGRMPNPAARTAIRAIRAALPAPSKTDSFVKEMTQALVQEGLIHKRTEKGPYSAYDVYSIPRNGREAAIATRCTRAALAAAAASPVTVAHGKAARDAIRARVGALPPIVLPVPEGVARAEAEAAAVASARVEELVKAGVDVSAVPQHELAEGSGPCINAELQWFRRLKSLRDRGDVAKARACEELLARVERWRDDTADRLNMAPGAVLPSHVAKRVAYALPQTVDGLRGAGVRIAGVETLAKVVRDAAEELGLLGGGSGGGAECASSGGGSGGAMRLGVVKGAPWAFAVYKPKKKKGCPDEPPPWEVSWTRFARGECVESIAMTQASGKSLQPSTVGGHVMEAPVHGREVDLARLYPNAGDARYHFASEREWRELDDACAVAGADPVGDPAAFSAREIVRVLVGADVADKDRALKTPEEQATQTRWYCKIKTYAALKRAGVAPKWDGDGGGGGPDAKRRRVD